jgi:hypothetical protein
VPPVPYVPSGPGAVPLPPSRPAMDYSRMAAEVDADPTLIPTMAKMVQGEVPSNASLQQRQIQAQSAFNRAQATGLPLRTALANGYYPPQTFTRGTGDVGAFKRDVLDPVLRGADPSSEAFNFPASQNASGGVASRGIQSGRYRPYATMGGEMYGQKRGEGAALERFRNPFGPPAVPGAEAADASPTDPDQVRNAITRQLVPPPSPAAPGVQVASLGNGGPLGNAAAASSVIPPVLPPGTTTPPVPGAVPPPTVAPTPPNVQPDIRTLPRTAQAPGIPGPLTPPTPTPTPPPAPGTPQEFRAPPPAPVKDTRPTPEEIYGTRLLRSHPDDPAYVAEAQRWMAAGAAKREAAYEQAKENHKNLMEDWKLGQAAAIAQQNPEAQLRLQEARQEAHRKQAEFEHFGGQTLAQALEPVKESYKEARKIPGQAIEIRKAQELVPKMFTGAPADINLSIAKWANAAGLPLDPKVVPTEAFKSYIQSVVAALRPQVEGTGTQSNVELGFLQKAAGADAKLEKGTIQDILNSVEKLNTLAAIEHQKKLLTFTGDDPNRQRAFGGFNVMEHAVPQAAVNALRQHYKEDPAAALKEFDEHYYTPGLAAKILKSGR